jgi:hypothetical protein
MVTLAAADPRSLEAPAVACPGREPFLGRQLVAR